MTPARPRTKSLRADGTRPRLRSSPQDRHADFALEAEGRAGPRMGAAQSKVASNDQSRRCSGLPPRRAGTSNAGRAVLGSGLARWRSARSAAVALWARTARGSETGLAELRLERRERG